MLFNSYAVFIYIVLFVLLFNIIRHSFKLRLLNNIVLIGADLLILLLFVKEHSLIIIAILSLIVFLLGRLMQINKSTAVLVGSLVFVIGLFSVRNYAPLLDMLTNSYFDFVKEPVLSVEKVGLSYILFRFVNFLVESWKRSIKRSDFLTFLSYIFFFPSFLAGPIDTYKNFHYWTGKTTFRYQRELFFAGITRIVIGAAKTLIIVPLVIGYATDFHVLLPDYSAIGALSLSLLCYSVYIYMDFSGYSDIAIGTAYLMGIKTPENFNNPYISQSLREFWKRWHITFSYFLRIYVFKPFIRLYNFIFRSKFYLTVSILAYLSTFLICGLWHGSTVNFVYWGLWHGVGLAINRLWISWVGKKKKLQDSLVYKGVSILITFVFVTVGWMFFQYSLPQLQEIFQLLF